MVKFSELYQNFPPEFVDNIINELPYGVVILNDKEIVCYVNNKISEFLSSAKELIGFPFCINDYTDDSFDYRQTTPVIFQKRNNKELLALQWRPLKNADEQIVGSLLMFYAFDNQNAYYNKIQEAANIDYLTKLPNRRGLYQYYELLNPNQPMHFMFLDIDNFKIVNDVYGHSTGDELLTMVSSNIINCASDYYISRIGGDEFVMVLSGLLSEQEVVNIARKTLKEINEANYRQDILTTISISIGIVLNQQPDCSLDEILYKCDSAMYRAKKNGKNQFIVYNSMEQEVKERKTIEEEMHLALSNHEFVVYLQPKMNMLTLRLYGAEALVRWKHPKDGLRFPDKFISIFENTGFIVELDMYVFEEVCKLKKSWGNESYKNIIISINMSRLHFFREDFVGKLTSILNKYEVKANEIEIEITESIFLRDSKEILHTVRELKKAGFYISVDDFGSGYSSLNMLKDIPADILKIDRAFLQLSEDNGKSKTVIKNVITMGKDLKLQLIAEGVETLDQVLFLTSCGCELAQGYYYSKPIPIDRFECFAKEHMLPDERVVKFSFQNNLKDDKNEFAGVYNGKKLTYSKGVIDGTNSIYLPGGEVYRNIIKLPGSIICSDSYTISLWVKSETSHAWTSLFYVEYENGFASLVPVAWEGASVYRIKDNREVSGWYDTSCCSLVMNEWIYVTITYDAKSEVSRYYSNGKQASYLKRIPALRVAKQIILGGDPYQDSFRGYICNFELYDHAKSADDIWNMYLEYVNDPSFIPMWETSNIMDGNEEFKEKNKLNEKAE